MVVIPAERSAASSPGLLSRSIFAAFANVSGLSATISLSLAAYCRRLSAMVVGAAACAEESRGTASILLVLKVAPSLSATVAGCGKLATTCIFFDQLLSSALLLSPLFLSLSTLNPPFFVVSPSACLFLACCDRRSERPCCSVHVLRCLVDHWELRRYYRVASY